MLQLTLPDTPHFFCISDTAACADMLTAQLICERKDGAAPAELAIDLKAQGMVKEPINIMVRDMLMLNVKVLLDAQCPFRSVTLLLHCTVGQIEQLGLRCGSALMQNRYIPDWEPNVLRCERLVFAPSADGSAVTVSFVNDAPAQQPASATPAAIAQTPTAPEDLRALIAADRSVLSYYEGDEQRRAVQLLNDAESAAGADPNRAAQLQSQAEDAMRVLIGLRTKQTKAYRDAVEQQ